MFLHDCEKWVYLCFCGVDSRAMCEIYNGGGQGETKTI